MQKNEPYAREPTGADSSISEELSNAQSSPPSPYLGFVNDASVINLVETSSSVSDSQHIGFSLPKAMHMSRDRLQTSLLFLVFVVLLVVCVLVFIYAESMSDVSGVIAALLTIVTTIVGALLAFYFQGKQ